MDPSSIRLTSSGDLIADRRFAYAQALASDGEHVAAADLFEQALDRVADWAPGWLVLAMAREKIGDRALAFAALERTMALDPDDRLGASLHRDRWLGITPDAMAPEFVAGLFDQYADRFDHHLAGALAYRGPALLLDALDRGFAHRETLGEVLDLGCGTGLMARGVAGRVDAIDGIDLSPRMIEQAQATGLYRTLVVGDLSPAMRAMQPGRYDLVLAADVFVYVGALAPVLRAIGDILRPKGRLAFTVQAKDGIGFTLGADMRFSHSLASVEEGLAAAGCTTLLVDDQSCRRDAGVDIPGLVVLACKA